MPTQINYAVVLRGGSIGEFKHAYVIKGLPIIKTFNLKQDAIEYAKQRNSRLTKGEKSYYKMRYSVIAIPKAKTRRNPGAAWHTKQYERWNATLNKVTSPHARGYVLGTADAHYLSASRAKRLKMNPAAKAYVGITHRAKPHLFTSSIRPSQVHLGAKYLKVYGPFKTYTDAEQFEDRLRKKHRMNPLDKWSAALRDWDKPVSIKVIKDRMLNEAKAHKATSIKIGRSKATIEFNDLMLAQAFGFWLNSHSINCVVDFKFIKNHEQKRYTFVISFKQTKRTIKKNPELGRASNEELVAIDMANGFGAKKIKEGLSWMKAIFNTSAASAKFCDWLKNKGYEYVIGRRSTGQDIVSFRFLKKNPPQATEIYSDVLAIEAQKGKDSLWPGEKFRHDFKKGGKIIGLDDGSLLIRPRKNGHKLWKNFNY